MDDFQVKWVQIHGIGTVAVVGFNALGNTPWNRGLREIWKN
jgi:hypothetical protein